MIIDTDTRKKKLLDINITNYTKLLSCNFLDEIYSIFKCEELDLIKNYIVTELYNLIKKIQNKQKNLYTYALLHKQVTKLYSIYEIYANNTTMLLFYHQMKNKDIDYIKF